MDESWLLFFFVGLLPQLIDGALGMAFGVTATTVMLSFGTAPAQASAIVHFAEIFTTAASGASSICSPRTVFRPPRKCRHGRDAARESSVHAPGP